jgi:hypothetical protein
VEVVTVQALVVEVFHLLVGDLDAAGSFRAPQDEFLFVNGEE